MKKINGDAADDHYQGKQPEYITMSNRPGIGRAWIEKYWTDVYPSDTCILDGKQFKPPSYYDKFIAEKAPEMWAQILENREKFGLDHLADNTDRRRLQRKVCKEKQLEKLPRTLENQ